MTSYVSYKIVFRNVISKINMDSFTLFFTFTSVLFRKVGKRERWGSVSRIYGTGTIGWENSALDQRKFYEIKLQKYDVTFLSSII